jgi:ribonuclease P protein component
MNEAFYPRERIKKKRDFLFLYKKGNRYKGKYFNLVYLSNDFCYSRMAVVVSSKIGNAVTRNRIKRWIRDLFRRNKELLKTSLDILFIIKKETAGVTWATLHESYIEAIASIYQEKQSS